MEGQSCCYCWRALWELDLKALHFGSAAKRKHLSSANAPDCLCLQLPSELPQPSPACENKPLSLCVSSLVGEYYGETGIFLSLVRALTLGHQDPRHRSYRRELCRATRRESTFSRLEFRAEMGVFSCAKENNSGEIVRCLCIPACRFAASAAKNVIYFAEKEHDLSMQTFK